MFRRVAGFQSESPGDLTAPPRSPAVGRVRYRTAQRTLGSSVRRGEVRIIGYERVSTARQGASGLGIEAQRQAIEGFVDQKGRHWSPASPRWRAGATPTGRSSARRCTSPRSPGRRWSSPSSTGSRVDPTLQFLGRGLEGAPFDRIRRPEIHQKNAQWEISKPMISFSLAPEKMLQCYGLVCLHGAPVSKARAVKI